MERKNKPKSKVDPVDSKDSPLEPTVVLQPSRVKQIWQKLRSMPPKKRWAVVGTIGGFILFFGAIIFTTYGPYTKDSGPLTQIVVQEIEIPPPPVVTAPSPLTGLPVDPETVDKPITAVIIENSIDARPQSGLEQSGVVFEAIAEGGITRFLAIYQHEEPENIGPIRSARKYFVRWAAGYDARFVHSGGSPGSLALIPSIGVKDLDHGIYGSRLARRVSTRFAPHNVYTSPETIESVGAGAGFTSTTYKGIERKEPEPSKIPTANTVTMNISGFNYNTRYTYRAKENDYIRFMAGQPHLDAETGRQISPEVVVALDMSYSIHPNRIHSVYGNVGSGKATIFQDGIATEATWKKKSDAAVLTLLDSAGDPIPINTGQTWFTAIQANRVSYE